MSALGPTTHEDGHGGRITILEPGGTTAPMRFRMVMPKGLGPPAPECHPSQSEDFTVLRGTLDLGVIDGKHVVLRAGETFHLPAGVYHLPANAGDDELEIEAVLTPGLESSAMFGELFAVLREHRGIARFAHLSVVFRRHTKAMRFKAPVRAIMTVVASIVRLFHARARPSPSPSPRLEPMKRAL